MSRQRRRGEQPQQLEQEPSLQEPLLLNEWEATAPASLALANSSATTRSSSRFIVGGNDDDLLEDASDDAAALSAAAAVAGKMRCYRALLVVGSAAGLVLALWVMIWTLAFRKEEDCKEQNQQQEQHKHKLQHQHNRSDSRDTATYSAGSNSTNDHTHEGDDPLHHWFNAASLAIATLLAISALSTLAGTSSWRSPIPGDTRAEARVEYEEDHDHDDDDDNPAACCRHLCLSSAGALHLSTSVWCGISSLACAALIRERNQDFQRWLPPVFRSFSPRDGEDDGSNSNRSNGNNNYLLAWILLIICASHILQRSLVRRFRSNLEQLRRLQRLGRRRRQFAGLVALAPSSSRPWWWQQTQHHADSSRGGHEGSAEEPSSFWHDDRRWFSWLRRKRHCSPSSGSNNPRDDGSVDFASVQEEWLNRSMEDPFWWSRDEHENDDRVIPRDDDQQEGSGRLYLGTKDGEEAQSTNSSSRRYSNSSPARKDVSWADE
jgi:hypothetical protein